MSAGESGNIFTQCGGTTGTRGCYGSHRGNEGVALTDTPQGGINVVGGTAPIPVPTVSASSDVDVTLQWAAPGNFHPTPANNGDPGTGGNPIVGIELWLLTSVSATADLNSRSVTDIDLQNPSAADPDWDLLKIDGVGPEGCFETATTTTTILFSSLDPAVTHFLPVAKICYLANADAASMRSTQYSANGAVVRVSAALPATVQNFDAQVAGKVRGETQVEVNFETTMESTELEGFNVYRSFDQAGARTLVGFLPKKGQGGEGAFYSITDSFKAQGAKQAWYALEMIEDGAPAGTVGPIRVDLKTGGPNK